MKVKKEYFLYLDILNIVACFAVVILHTTGKFFRPDSSLQWKVSCLLQSVFIWAVPVFFMLTGATLLEYNKRYRTSEFFKKRFTRVILPFSIWSVIYLVWKLGTGQLAFNGMREFASLFLENKILSIFWFFYTLIPIYLFLPILNIFIVNSSKKIIQYFILLGIWSMSFIPLLNRVSGLNINSLSIQMTGGVMTYVVLGWYLKNNVISKNLRKIIYSLSIFSILLMFFFTKNSIGNDAPDKLLITSTSITTVILASAVFIFFKEAKLSFLASKAKLVQRISSASFGVYLIQMIVIYYLGKIPIVKTDSISYMIFGALFVYIVSIGIVLIIKRIPVIKHVIP